jgi:hypothetical protein
MTYLTEIFCGTLIIALLITAKIGGRAGKPPILEIS